VVHQPVAYVVRGKSHAVAQRRESTHDRVVHAPDAAGHADGVAGLPSRVRRATKAQRARDHGGHRGHHGLDDRAQHHGAEHVDYRVAQVAGKAFAALEATHEGVGQALFDDACGALPLLGRLLGCARVGFAGFALVGDGDQVAPGTDLALDGHHIAAVLAGALQGRLALAQPGNGHLLDCLGQADVLLRGHSGGALFVAHPVERLLYLLRAAL